MINKAMIVGRLGADPESKFTQGGKMVTTFRVATDRHWKDSDGQSLKETEWHTVYVI
jgi:single-strand DNA-binding protein